MSGYKYSDFSLALERARKHEHLQRIRNAYSEAQGLSERISEQIESASEGLLETFVEETARAQRWLEQLELPNLQRLGMRTSLGILQDIRAELDQVVARGRRVQKVLSVSFTQKADALGQELAGRLADLEGRFAAARELLRLWLAEEDREALEEDLREGRRLLDLEYYTELRQLLTRLAGWLEDKTSWAERQEDMHQKRLYLLQALRQVCADMGFEEVAAPEFEGPGDRGSRIRFVVDTIDRGQISFSLSLEGLNSFSEIADDRCFEEFGRISQYLEKEFGIQTRFHTADGEPLPKLIRKGEMDLPDDAAMAVEAQG